ncbi:MAG: DUF983 domain-containing protein [Alphaproteobacteria bacterium]|nr:DUF983 domain-containing protein [Alphaproteobacteria bacterium]
MFEVRSWQQASLRGFNCKCPACGRGRLFGRYLKVVDQCAACGEELHYQRADDAPPYLTIVVVAHIIVPMLLVVEKVWKPALWLDLAIFLPLTAILTLVLLPMLKGVVVGLQWANRMHGFGLSGSFHSDQ